MITLLGLIRRNADSIFECVENYLFITEDALPNTPTTALVMLGAETAMAIAINDNMIAYSTIVTPFVLFFLFIHSSLNDSLFERLDTHGHYVTSFRPNLKRAKVPSGQW